MSYGLTKILTGAYNFPVAADRAETLKNLRVGGNIVALTIASSAATANASLANTFSVAPAASFTLTVSNLVDGQTIRVLVSPAGGASTVTVSPNDGDAIASIADAAIATIIITKFGTKVYAYKETVKS